MVAARYVPDAGHIVWLAFSPRAGHEQAGRRPALVLSPRDYDGRTRLALLCPVTSRIKGYPFQVPPPSSGAVTGVVLADRVKSVDWRARGARFEVETPPEVVTEIREKLTVLLK